MSKLNRREFLQRAAAAGAVLAGAGAFATACSKKEACLDLDALEADARQIVEQNNYVDRSPKASENCANCTFFTAEEGSCGPCTLFLGASVAAEGYCDGWVEKPTA